MQQTELAFLLDSLLLLHEDTQEQRREKLGRKCWTDELFFLVLCISICCKELLQGMSYPRIYELYLKRKDGTQAEYPGKAAVKTDFHKFTSWWNKDVGLFGVRDIWNDLLLNTSAKVSLGWPKCGDVKGLQYSRIVVKESWRNQVQTKFQVRCGFGQISAVLLSVSLAGISGGTFFTFFWKEGSFWIQNWSHAREIRIHTWCGCPAGRRFLHHLADYCGFVWNGETAKHAAWIAKQDNCCWSHDHFVCCSAVLVSDCENSRRS